MPWYTTADARRDAERQATQKARKRWVPIGFAECDECGDDAVWILTDCDDVGYFFDGDDAQCYECGNKGQFSCDAETPGYISWHGKI